LSISSLKAKKEHELNKKDHSIDESQLPKSAFTEEEMQKHWADFVEKIDSEGRKILASNLHADVPKIIEDTIIWIEMPNGTMKKEIEREQYDLMEYLKLKLNNYGISLRITVNEEIVKKFAFTPEEKYEKLRPLFYIFYITYANFKTFKLFRIGIEKTNKSTNSRT